MLYKIIYPKNINIKVLEFIKFIKKLKIMQLNIIRFSLLNF
jgi:hypothetical protein